MSTFKFEDLTQQQQEVFTGHAKEMASFYKKKDETLEDYVANFIDGVIKGGEEKAIKYVDHLIAMKDGSHGMLVKVEKPQDPVSQQPKSSNIGTYKI